MIILLSSSFKIAINSLSVNKARSVLTVLGIVIGVSAVIILVSVGSGLKLLISNQFLNLGANLLLVLPGEVDLAKGGDLRQQFTAVNNSKLDETDLKTIRSLNGVSGTLPILNNFQSVGYQGEKMIAEVNGTSEDLLTMLNWSLIEGRFFTPSEMLAGKKVMVIGIKIRDEVFKGQALNKSLRVGGDNFRIVGILSAKGGTGQHDWDTHVFMPLEAAKTFFGRDKLAVIYFKAESANLVKPVVKEVEATLLRRHKKEDFSVVEQSDLLKSVTKIINALTLALGGIAAISLLVGGIGIMNIMLVSVTERTKEIGLRKAVGARRADILWQFLVEAVVLSSLGGILGIALGFLGSLALGRFLATSVTAWSVVLSFTVSALVGIIFGVFPAYKAAKLDPIEALRYE